MQPRTHALGLAAVLALAFSALGFSQSKVPDRLTSPIVASQRTITNPVLQQATRQNDAGRVSGSRVFHRMVLILQRSSAQEAALQQLLAEQQDPKSPLYHQWLTP
ncbi:MAG: protease pro-enzyme activation domain-containing protein, partial [Acidobacteriota bacterium]